MRSPLLPNRFAYTKPHAALREDDLRARYLRQPGAAWQTYISWSDASGAAIADGLGGQVLLGLAGHPVDYSIDESLGGSHDSPAPAEMLCAALTACLDSSIRLAAGRLGVALDRLVIIVAGDVDALGALGEPGVPPGMQSIRVEVQLAIAGPAAGPALIDRLLDAA